MHEAVITFIVCSVLLVQIQIRNSIHGLFIVFEVEQSAKLLFLMNDGNHGII